MKTKHHFPIPRPRPLIIAALLGLAVASTQAATVTPPAASPPASAVQEDIRDIRPPIHIPVAWPWLATAAGGAALLAAGYGAWRRGRKGQRALLPYEVALAKLEAARALMHPETAREFSIAVSEVVRAFIEECFPVRAAHRTTDEFLHELATQADSPLVAHRETFEDFLNHCDLAKFARWQLPVPRMEAMLLSARSLILSIGAPSKTAEPIPPIPEPALTQS